MTLTCCNRHSAGIPLVGDDAAIRCGDLTAEDIGTLRAAAEDAQARAADPDVGVLYWRSDVPALAAALLATLEQLARVTGERDALRAELAALRPAPRAPVDDPRAEVADGRAPLVVADGPLDID